MPTVNYNLIIVRGLPGTGKSEYAKTLRIFFDCTIYEYEQCSNKYTAEYYNSDLTSKQICDKSIYNDITEGRVVIIVGRFAKYKDIESVLEIGFATKANILVLHKTNVLKRNTSLKEMKQLYLDMDSLGRIVKNAKYYISPNIKLTIRTIL